MERSKTKIRVNAMSVEMSSYTYIVREIFEIQFLFDDCSICNHNVSVMKLHVITYKTDKE